MVHPPRADEPVRVQQYPRTDEEIASFLSWLGVPGIVDVHVHAMPDPLQQAVWRYFDELTDPPWPIRYRDDLATRLAQLRSFGVVAHTALAYAHRPGMLRWLNDFTLDLADEHPQVVPTFTVYPEDGVTDLTVAALSRGGVVCKVHTQLSGYLLDDHRLDDVWRLLTDARTLVVAHTSAVYGVDGGRATSGGAQVHRVTRRHPGLRLSIAHLGLPDPDGSQWSAIEDLDRVWTDPSGALVDPAPQVAPTGVVDVEQVSRRLRGSLLFGSDHPSVPYSYADQLRGLAGLRLDPSELREVLHDRPRRLLSEAGWTPPGGRTGAAAPGRPIGSAP